MATIRNSTVRYGLALVAALMTGLVAPGAARADTSSRFGPAVDAFCTGPNGNGSTPYADQSCNLCHNGGNFSQRVDPQWGWWETGDRTGDFSGFCPPAVNQAPNGTIAEPNANITITAGQSVRFRGNGSDPDGDALSYRWTFSGGIADRTGAGPHNVTFNSTGTFTARLTVTDDRGLADPTPPERRVTVNAPPPNCTDADGDGFAREGGSCGPVDCNDANAAVNPNATESCTDGIDNNCNGLVDADDPAAQSCPVVCTDADGDGFALEGGSCGLVDCNDANAAVNPGAVENCTDGVDNNCNTLVDADDPAAQSCPVASACMDNDGDLFSPEGGICGPIDCDDFDPAVNPGATESCGDGTDNDCDGAIDGDDPECDPNSPCARLGQDAQDLVIDSAAYNRRRDRLVIRGSGLNRGEIVVVTDAVTGELVGSDDVNRRGNWRVRIDDPAAIPCRVRAAIPGHFGEMDVRNAPSDCGVQAPNQPPTCTVVSPSGNVSIVAGSPVRFQGAGSDADGDLPLAFAWNFGGGAPNAAVASPGDVVFATPGTYSVSFTVTDARGAACAAPGERTVTVTEPPNQAPTCSITAPAGNVSIEAGESVTFAGTASDPDGNTPLGFAWNFGGGAPASTAQNPGAVQFATPGTYAVSFAATDARGLRCEAPATRTVTVTEPPPPPPVTVVIDKASWDAGEREFEVEGRNAPVGATVRVSNAASGTALGTTRVNSLGQWEFELNGLVSIPCRVRVEIDGASAERDVSGAPANCDGGAPVNQAPVCTIDQPAGNPTITEGQTVTFAGTATDPDGDTLSLRWTFGGGAADRTVEDPGAVRFDQAGSFTVRFQATDPSGARCAATRQVQVNAAPQANLSVSRARWESGERELDVDGAGAAPNATVRVLDADSGAVLGLTVARSDGRWEFEVSSPSPVPCRIRAESGGSSVVRTVEDAPSDCGTTGGGAEPPPAEEPEDPPPSGEAAFTAHPISSSYVSNGHERDWRERSSFCASCHGSNLRGTEASATFAARAWPSDDRQPDGSRTKRYAAGDIVGCMDCHGDPRNDD